MSSISIIEIFKVGIGPSSSHTIGPMKAACRFAQVLSEKLIFQETTQITVELFGSLAMTGKGHATDIAVLLGLEGELPDKIDPETIHSRISTIRKTKTLKVNGEKEIFFDPEIDLQFLKGKRLTYHSNAMRIRALNSQGKVLYMRVFYSVGGGFVLDHDEAMIGKVQKVNLVPFYFKTARELLEHSKKESRAIWEIVWKNETSLRPAYEVQESIFQIWEAMRDSVRRGLESKGELPGGLGVKRRAFDLHQKLLHRPIDPTSVFDWVSLFALAVNEENAAGSRIVTAPTNGSAGVIPAVLHYAEKFLPSFDDEKLFIFLLTATAIGILFKEGASISAAEMGCQGEIGVSSSMAAAGLAAILGGTTEQIENAAEIAMEHHLGLTCDPVGGLVQIPCIERNAMGAIKAINAANLAMQGDGTHVVSLDAVIKAMKETGENMKSIYKETSEGGLALQVSVMETVC